VKQVYPLLALAVLLAGGWFFASNFRVDLSDPEAGLQIQPRDGQAGTGFTMPPLFGGEATPETPWSGNAEGPAVEPRPLSPGVAAPVNNLPVSAPPAATREFIRIASFNIQVFGEAKLSQREVVDVLAAITRNFDIVAIQEVRAQNQNVLPAFVQYVNAGRYRYDFVIGDRVGRSSSKEQFAFVFNTDTVEVDRRTMYTVSDPDDLIHREPLVAWFRCRQADPREAFTFSLVNVHTDPDEVDLRHPNNELDVLDDVFRAVRDDGRGEDDVIMAGDFNAPYNKLGHLNRIPGMFFVVTVDPMGALLATNTRGNAQYDNLVFDQTATVEYLGRGGVFDFMREYNLSLNQALAVSDHLPVWAEFSIYEGGIRGRMAGNGQELRR
jgi:deoxyribonuclease-1-like protein